LALASHQTIAKQNFGHQFCAELGASRCTFDSCFDGSTTEVVR
jgi:hypothetical protein